MDNILNKLKYKEHNRIAVINAPDKFNRRVAKLIPDVQIDNEINAKYLYDFMIAFASGSEEVDRFGPSCIHNLSNDGKLWIAYPKGTSKKMAADINRDRGWEQIEEAGFRRVSQVAIDEDWSALRFRNAKFVKSGRR